MNVCWPRRMSIGNFGTVLLSILVTGVGFLTAVPASGDGPADNNPQTVRRIPREGIDVPPDREAALRTKLGSLQQKIEQARRLESVVDSGLLPDVMIFERAVRCALDYDEFFDAKELDRAEKLLDEGISRADELIAGSPSWPTQRGLIVRGYISRIDNTVQPYGLWIADDVDLSRGIPARCDIWFHGRGETLSEVNFLWDRMQNPGQYTPDGCIVLHPYGRYSNAFKFAGETDVLEALEDVRRRYRIDEDRISVRGFSMGGAACWQFATHYADRWFAANPGAGFSETPQFLKTFQNETLNPKPWEVALWNLYDCDKYAANLWHCPTIAYSGELDKQKQAADVMEAALAEHGIRLRHVIGADMGHRIDDASKATIEAAMASLARRGRGSVPREIRFETHTLRYNRMHWLTVDELDEHWKPAQVSARMMSSENPPVPLVVVVSVSNVAALTIELPAGAILVDQLPLHLLERPLSEAARPYVLLTSEGLEGGESRQPLPLEGPFSDGSLRLQTHRDDSGRWQVGPRPRDLRKRHGLQGPVDDALMDSFVFVRPTAGSWHASVDRWVQSELNRAVEHWRRHFRGDARVVNDRDLTEELIQSANLILWGDPSSNSILQKIADELPIRWSAETVTVGSTSCDSSSHVPILICPNPLNPDRYVVLNSSFTFREYAYLNNARQVPMLPDWAVINLDTPPGTVWPGEVVAADFFDEQWRVKP